MTRVAVHVAPPSARLFLDESPFPNPFVTERPRDGSPHRLRVEAPGYVAASRDISFQVDADIEIELVPEPRFIHRRSRAQGRASRVVVAAPAPGPSNGNPY
jgi:hypothetical protein